MITPHRSFSALLRSSFLAVFYVFLLAPILVVVAEAFSSAEVMVFPPPGWSLRWFAALGASADFLNSFRLSLILAVLAAVVSGCVGTAAAYGLVRHRGAGQSTLETLLVTPLYVPEILIGMALLLALSIFTLAGSLLGLEVAHVLITIPYVMRTVLASMRQLDVTIEEAARALGARPWQVFWRVTFPMIRPGVVAGVVFAFVISFSDIYMALFLAGPHTITLPLRIYNYLQWQQTPLVAVVSTVQIIIIGVLFTIASRISRVSLHGR